jgi:DNA invertase Pin-like site-specific DNA recombinase
MKSGDARVSTDDQNVDTQMRQLTKAGCKKVFHETANRTETEGATVAEMSWKVIG